MSSQKPNLHSIKTPSDFTFCDIPKRNFHRKHDENENLFRFAPPLWPVNTHSKSVMVEGRKELMEMINDLPGSCFELSLKDTVEKEKVDMKPELKGKEKDVKKSSISRSVSLDTGVILLKMFVPSSFGLKKHKVSRSTSMNDSKKSYVDVKQRKTWLFADTKSSRSYNDNRYTEKTLKPGCWFKLKNQKGCIFF